MILVLYLGHGVFHPVAVLFFYSKTGFGRSLKLPNRVTSEKTRGASIVARVKRHHNTYTSCDRHALSFLG